MKNRDVALELMEGLGLKSPMLADWVRDILDKHYPEKTVPHDLGVTPQHELRQKRVPTDEEIKAALEQVDLP